MEKEGCRGISNDLTRLYPPRFHMCHSFLYLATNKNIYIFFYFLIHARMYQYFLTQITNNEIQKYVQSFYLPNNYLIYGLLFIAFGGFFNRRQSERVLKLTTHLYLAPRIRANCALLLPLKASMAPTATAFPGRLIFLWFSFSSFVSELHNLNRSSPSP